MKRVVVTGLGAVTPVGNDIPTFWENLSNGVSGIGLIHHFDTADYKAKVAAEVKDFDITRYVDKMAAKRLDLFSQYAVSAAQQAMEDSGSPATPNGSASISLGDRGAFHNGPRGGKASQKRTPPRLPHDHSDDDRQPCRRKCCHPLQSHRGPACRS